MSGKSLYLCGIILIGVVMENKAEICPKVFFSYSYDSEEHKVWVLQLATRLRSNGVDVILDRWNTKLGSDLATFMENGLSGSHRVVCVCSDEYVRKANEKAGGVGYEKQIMTVQLIRNQNSDWVIPLIKNNTREEKMPLFLSGRVYIDFDDPCLYERRYEELLRDLLDEPVLPIPPIGKNPFQTIKSFTQRRFLPASEKYCSPAVKGIVTFDYSNNDGRYVIGQDALMFETCWSKASSTSIHLYSDPISVRTVALVKDIADIAEIKDARIYDTSSRVRTVRTNQIGVLQNMNGFYAAIKVLSIKNDSRGDDHDEIIFEYQIQTNGSPDFIC
jgi:hypothetical protein